MPQENKLVNLDAVKDIFGRPAGWMLYWGNAAILLLLAGIIALTAFIRYPDKVDLQVRISTPSPPSPMVAPISGAIERVFFEEGDGVRLSQEILLLDNTAKWEDIILLDDKLNKIASFQQATDVFNFDLPEHLDVGELGASYAAILNHITTLKYWLERSQQASRAKRLNLQLAQINKQNSHLTKQFGQLIEEKEIAERNASEYTALLEKGAASQLEADQAASRLLQVNRQLEAQQNLLLQNDIQTESLELEKIRLGEQLSDQITEEWLALKQEQRSMKQAVNNWEDQYIIKAKSAGVITYFQPLSMGQYIEAGQQLGSIVPNDTDSLSYIAEGYLNSQGVGKILSGQAVFIALDAYPYREFGQLKGYVQQLALAPMSQENEYRIVIELPEKLRSTYDKDLGFRQQLKGVASIITEDRSLLDRIFDRFRDLKNA